MEGVSGSIYPEIHIIEAEASATSIDYRGARGFEAIIFGSAQKLASAVISELEDDVAKSYRRIDQG